jgi:hypothetical protein
MGVGDRDDAADHRRHCFEVLTESDIQAAAEPGDLRVITDSDDLEVRVAWITEPFGPA